MAVAALTPRVRSIIICDDIFTSATAEDVFTLEGVRLHIGATSLPLRAEINLFMIASSVRKGNYAGKILVVNQQTDKLTRYVKFFATFDGTNELVPLAVFLGGCSFPAAGQYRFEIYFAAPGGHEALKGELPFYVLSDEE
jgi:hypothetical protein